MAGVRTLVPNGAVVAHRKKGEKTKTSRNHYRRVIVGRVQPVRTYVEVHLLLCSSLRADRIVSRKVNERPSMNENHTNLMIRRFTGDRVGTNLARSWRRGGIH